MTNVFEIKCMYLCSKAMGNGLFQAFLYGGIWMLKNKTLIGKLI